MNKDLPTDPRIPQPNIVLTQGVQGPSQSETKTNAPLARESAEAPNLTSGSTRTKKTQKSPASSFYATGVDDNKPKYDFDYFESAYGSGAVSSQFLLPNNPRYAEPGPSRPSQRYVGDVTLVTPVVLEPTTATLVEVPIPPAGDPATDPPLKKKKKKKNAPAE